MTDKDRQPLSFLRGSLLELGVHTFLRVAFILLVIWLLEHTLTAWFELNLLGYTLLGLALLVTQGLVLDLLGSFLLSRIK